MPLVGEELMAFVEETIADAKDLRIFRNLYGDEYQFREIDTGRFAYGANLWSLFRESYEGGGM